jgi:hypothetical protein
MAITEQDRDWIKAMIKEATIEALNESRDFARARLDSHVRACPNLQRLKWMLIGLGLGLGSQAPMLIKGIASALAA